MFAVLCAAVLPARAAVPLDPALARMPVIERIVSAPVFEEPLTWVGDDLPGDEESESLWAAIDVMRQFGPKAGFEALEAFIEAYPDSAWIPAVGCNLAFRYREMGRYTLALEHWAAAWDATAEAQDPGGKRVADYTLAHWSSLLVSLGRQEALTVLFAETQGRELDGGPLQERLYATQESYRRMMHDPSVAYRCGTLAVMRLARELALPNTDLSKVMNAQAPGTGFSLAELQDLATGAGLPVVPLLRPEDDGSLVIPSVVHWRQNHYAALVEAWDDYVLVDDPTFGHPRWLHTDVINAEASGYFLALPTAAPKSWSRITRSEAAQVFGGGYPTVVDDDDDEMCPAEDPTAEEVDQAAPISEHNPNTQSDSEACAAGNPNEEGGCIGSGNGNGLAAWRVSEPYISLWIMDKPLYYTTSYGRLSAFKLAYKQRNTRAQDGRSWGMGPRWESSRLSFVRQDAGVPGEVSLYTLQGGRRVYNPDGVTPHYRSNTRMTQSLNSYSLTGSQPGRIVYGFAQPFYDGVTRYYESEQTDRWGRTTLLQHSIYNSTIARLDYIVDPDGRTSSLTYSPTVPDRLIQVTDPYGRMTKLYYNATNSLWKIEDTQGYVSEFSYAPDGRLQSMITPYGLRNGVASIYCSFYGR